MARKTPDQEATGTTEDAATTDTGAAGSVTNAYDKPDYDKPADTAKRERKPRSPNAAKSDGLTPDDLRAFEAHLTTTIDSGKATATDDELEALFASRKRVRALIAKGGAA